jgi:1,6-anhydro-N-acetylmuramate kinase
MRVIGLMSGTSYDAIDAAAAGLSLVGDSVVLEPLGMVSAPYDEELREALAAALPPAATTLAEVCRLDTLIGQAFAAAAVRANDELCDGRAELVASHGQTVYHWVADGAVHGTLQLGQPAWIAEATGLPVVADFRPRDIAAGGQGAPLVSLVDLLWLRGRSGTPVALNLGGIANLTAPDGTAFDTGPACALIDAAASRPVERSTSRCCNGCRASRTTRCPRRRRPARSCSTSAICRTRWPAWAPCPPRTSSRPSPCSRPARSRTPCGRWPRRRSSSRAAAPATRS